MTPAQLALLNQTERMLALETEPARLAELDEDEVAALHDRVRKARAKAVSQYRRGATQKVAKAGARGQANPKSSLARAKAEVWEDALARVSRRLAVLASQSAKELRDERIAAARAAKAGSATPRATAAKKASPAKAPAAKAAAPARRRTVTDAPAGDRARTRPATQKARAATRASGARRQAKRDSRG